MEGFKSRFFIILLCVIFISGAYSKHSSLVRSTPLEKINVVTSISVLEDFVKEIGGEKVEVKTLITGLETPHTFSPKPKDKINLLSSDIFFKVGLGLESWVDKLLDSAPDELLIVDTSEGVEVIDSHEDHDHLGNPHIWLDPENAITMARHIADALIAKNPENKDYFEERYIEYTKKIRKVSDELKKRVEMLEDKRVVVFPASYPYLLKAFGFETVATVEEVHGQEISAKRLAEIIKVIREEKVKLVIAECQFSDKDARTICEESGAEIVYLTPLLAPQIFPETKDYIGMIRYNVGEIVRALEGESGN